MKALIHNDKVIQLNNIGFSVHESLTWMEAPVGCKVGWVLSNGSLVEPQEPQKTQEEMLAELRLALKSHLSVVARQKDYDNEQSIMTYVDSTNLTWAAEAKAYSDWRDAVWLYAIEQLGLFESGKRAIVTTSEFINELPAIAWPL